MPILACEIPMQVFEENAAPWSSLVNGFKDLVSEAQFIFLAFCQQSFPLQRPALRELF